MLTCDLKQHATVALGDRAETESLDLSEMRAAIAALLFEVPERLDVRYLWTSGRLNYFRVNWWSPRNTEVRRIVRSVFVQVEVLPDGWRIQQRAAA